MNHRHKCQCVKVDFDIGRSMHRKVKSGCRTCKYGFQDLDVQPLTFLRRRKLKCDERWPVCGRCQLSGRCCEGYGIWGGGSGHETFPPSATKCSARSPEQPLQLLALQTREQDCLEWYIRRSSVKLFGVFSSEIWTSILLQASATEPAVRHAVLTLSSAHKEEVSGVSILGQENNDTQALFTVSQYSKAIHHLNSNFGTERKTSQQTTLIACALFVSTEFLRGHYTSGLLHLDFGLQLLRKSTCTFNPSPISMCIDGWLITMFTRYLVQAKLLGQTSITTYLTAYPFEVEARCQTFTSIHHARRCLEHILLHALDMHEGFLSPLDIDNSIQQVRLQTALLSWLKIHRTTLSNLPPTTSFFESFAYRLLLLYYYIGCILVETCLDPSDELAYDRCETQFSKIVNHCEETEVLIFKHNGNDRNRHRDPEATSPNSIVDMGWVAPLYFTVIKCRNHRIRHSAMRLLQLSRHKEGIWSTDLILEVAKMVTETEESSFYAAARCSKKQLYPLPGDDDVLFPTLPLQYRLSDVKISLPVDRLGKLGFTASRRKPNNKRERIDKEFNLCTRQWKTRSADQMSTCETQQMRGLVSERTIGIADALHGF